MSNNMTQGDYMLNAIKKIHLSGDSFTDIQTLFNNCIGCSNNSSLHEDLMHLCAKGTLIMEGGKVSSAYIASC